MSIQQLREHREEISRQANEILAKKGAQTWTPEDNKKFDDLVDELTRLDAQIEAHQTMLKDRAEACGDDAQRKSKDEHPTLASIGFEAYLRKSFKDMKPEEQHAFQNTMSTTTGSQGGYTVDPLVAKTYVDQLADYGGVRRVADNIRTENGVTINYPTSDGRAEIGEIVAQNASASASDPSFGVVAIGAFKFSSTIVAIPYELVQDSSIDIVAMVRKRLIDRIGRIQNRKFTIGAGTTEPLGITAAATVRVTGQTGQTLTIIYDNFVDLIDSIDIAYLAEGPLTWNMAQSLRKVVRKIKDTAGRPIFLPGYGSIEEGFGDSLLGYPININNDMPTPAANAKSLSFGQHKKYLTRDTMEITILRFDDSVYASKGQVGFLAFARADGNLLDTASISLYQHSAT